MKCYVTGNSPYARKVRVATIETGLWDEVEWQMITREQRAEMIPGINPLGKVPVAILDSGDVLYDSPVICAYVDSLNAGRKLIPEAGPARWLVLTLEALGDGLGEAVIAASQEDQRPGEKRSQGVVDRQKGKVTSALTVLDAAAADFNVPPLMGEIAVACALGYMEFRDVVPGWRETYANLADWYTAILKRRSFIQTAPD
ncbi:MAG: glutathione S-transferase N-terminal domain-containing protein [Proteobacteria bacterium]|nr:glutathione S-transferase N-terminal domain-containing protein [Pseudomonadota bacterium]MDA1326235.1 glutathione S-transferase N-terminal domain-containing protein [Pseudomonadota bacterium]